MHTAMRPEDEFNEKVAAFLEAAPASTAGIANLATRVDCVGHGDRRIPVSVNFSEPDNAWVCSPHTTYARYAVEELRRWGHPWLTGPLSLLCQTLGAYLGRARLDDCVALNNWLLSTNLYPPLETKMLRGWVTEALDRWPRHALWVRSLNRRYTAQWLEALVDAGFTLIPSRQVYLYDCIDRSARMPQNLRRDLQLLDSTGLVRNAAADWSAADFGRAERLYWQLYLHKYSRLNPAYTAGFLRAWHDAGLLELFGYRDAMGTLQGVVGLFGIGDTITAPIVGYATERPTKEGLYRLLMATVYEQAACLGRRINLSAGAAHFKRLRGGVAALEYSAVYTRHLPGPRRRAIEVLSLLTRRIGEPCMRYFEL